MEKAWLRWAFALLLVTAVSACGDDSSGDPDGGAGTGGDGDGDGDSGGDGDGDGDIGPVSEMIDAAQGGTLEANGVELEIPGGALEEDTEITVEVILADDLPEADSIASLVYELGPDGQTFSEPVTLTIELNATVPEGMAPKMAWLDEDTDTWMELEDSAVDGDTVTATTTHFTAFAIILTSEGQVAGGCEELNFEACGGDVVGTWEFSLACADLTAESIFGADNPFENCEGFIFAATVDMSGSITIEEGGAYSSDRESSFEIEMTIPRSCVMDAPCSSFEEMEGATVVDNGDTCTVTNTYSETQVEEGTYELDGNSIILDDGDETDTDEPAEYCVAGDVLTVRSVDIDEETMAETVVFFQAMRQ